MMNLLSTPVADLEAELAKADRKAAEERAKLTAKLAAARQEQAAEERAAALRAASKAAQEAKKTFDTTAAEYEKTQAAITGHLAGLVVALSRSRELANIGKTAVDVMRDGGIEEPNRGVFSVDYNLLRDPNALVAEAQKLVADRWLDSTSFEAISIPVCNFKTR